MNKYSYQDMLNTILDNKLSKTKTPQFSEDQIEGWNGAIDLCHNIVEKRRDQIEKKEKTNGKGI